MGRAARWFILVSAMGFLPAPAPAQSLRELAAQRGINVGTAVRPSLFSEPGYAGTLAREYNMLEAEDVMKWWVVRPDRDTFDFRQADQAVAFAESHGMKVRGHTLVWGSSNPEWLRNLRTSPNELSELLHQHIQRLVTHFRGKVFAWDVVNEAFDEHGKVKPSIWYDQPGIGLSGQGTAYIEKSLRWTHEADPEALLFYNDAEAETLNVKSDAIYAMVRDFRKRGVPIDGVGLQMHVLDMNPDIEGIRANIFRLTELGVQVHITELDVALPVGPDGTASASDLERQAQIYRQIALACLRIRGCTALQTWGFTDKWSWIGSKTKHAKGAALPFDRSYAPKPAYHALRDALAAKPVGPRASTSP